MKDEELNKLIVNFIYFVASHSNIPLFMRLIFGYWA